MSALSRTVAVSLLLAASATPQQRPAPRPPTQPGRAAAAPRPAYMQQLRAYEEGSYVTRGVLKNGLTVLINEFRGAPVVSLVTYARTGPLDESPDRAGAASELARRLFRASGTRAAGVIDADLRTLGGRLRSFAAFGHTVSALVAPSIQWKRALELQADALMDPILDAGERKELDASSTVAFPRSAPGSPGEAELYALAFGRSPFGTPAGDVPRAKLVEQQKLMAAPGRMVLAISGDVNAPDVLAEAVRVYGKVAASSDRAAPARASSEGSGFRYRQMRQPAAAVGIEVGFPAPAVTSEDYPALAVAAAMLGVGDGAILPRRLRDQKNVIVGGRAELVAEDGVGLLRVGVETEAEHVDRAEIALFTELELLKRLEPDAGDLARARAQLERAHWLALETVEGRAAVLARFEALGGWKGMNDYLPRLERVKAADVNRVARKYLVLDRASLVEILPVQAEERSLSPEALQTTVRNLLEPAVAQEAAAREAETVQAVAIPEGPSGFKYSEVRYPMHKASVLRGPELFIREDHTAPLIEMGLFFPGGKLLEVRENAGITALMVNAILRGGKEGARDHFYRQLEIYGGRILPVVEDDYFGFRLTVLSANIERAFDLVFALVKGVKFDAETITREKARQLVELRRESLAEGSDGRLEEALFRDFAYALPRLGTEASLAALTPEKVTAWHKSSMEYRKPVVVLIGDTQGTSLARYFVRNFSGSRYEDIKLPEAVPKPLGARVAVDASGPAGESQILIGFQAPPAGDEDSYPMIVLESYAAGPAGRLQDELRDRQKVVESIDLAYRRLLRGGSVVVRAAVKPGGEEKALAALDEEVRKLPTAQVLYRDYRAAVNRAVASYWIDQQSHAAQVDRMMTFVLEGHSVDEIGTYPARLQAVREEDLAPIARRILTPDKSVILRIRPK